MATLLQRSIFMTTLALVATSFAACGAGESPVAFERAETRTATAAALALQSQAFADGQPIPTRYSAYGDDVSPPLAWQPVEGAKSYALLMEDPDADRPHPYLHWLAWNIPAGVTSLPEGLAADPRLAEPDGMLQGTNDRGSVGYFGPRPPAGSGIHHYHVQVFALDTMLEVDPGAGRDALLGAMRDHVMDKGVLVGTYAGPEEAAQSE
ncbi:YbhB/YbcL family Raf kinase inhibitor-like protein [Luteimonas sp. MJ204]|uniref:YbhB/YbcL family Raf kinase inhibitor-like protein n=1 Tax=Luteimonas TaxID=83614 RepID=UPI0031BAC592